MWTDCLHPLNGHSYMLLEQTNKKFERGKGTEPRDPSNIHLVFVFVSVTTVCPNSERLSLLLVEHRLYDPIGSGWFSVGIVIYSNEFAYMSVRSRRAYLYAFARWMIRATHFRWTPEHSRIGRYVCRQCDRQMARWIFRLVSVCELAAYEKHGQTYPTENTMWPRAAKCLCLYSNVKPETVMEDFGGHKRIVWTKWMFSHGILEWFPVFISFLYSRVVQDSAWVRDYIHLSKGWVESIYRQVYARE